MRTTLKILYATCFLDVSGVTRINFDILSEISTECEIHVCETESDVHLSATWDRRFAASFREPFKLWQVLRRNRYRRFLEYICEHQIDLVYITHSVWLYEHVARLKRDLPTLKIVDSLHLLEPYCFRGGFPDISANRFVHPHIDRSVLISEDLRQYLTRNYRVDPNKLMVIQNGIDGGHFDRHAGNGNVLRTELGVAPADQLVGFIGRFALQKRPLLFVEIACDLVKRNPNLVFYMVGSGPLEANIRKSIARRGLMKRMHIMGTRSDIPSLLAATDILLMPSAYEGAPLTILEALAVGVPVVASDVGAVREYVGHRCSLVPMKPGRGKRKEFVTAVLEGLTESRQSGFLAPHHEISAVAEEYLRLFKETVAERETRK